MKVQLIVDDESYFFWDIMEDYPNLTNGGIYDVLDIDENTGDYLLENDEGVEVWYSPFYLDTLARGY